MSKVFVLQDEYRNLLSKDQEIFFWLNEDVLNGTWYYNFDSADFWVSNSFWKTLQLPIPSDQVKEHIQSSFKGDLKKDICEVLEAHSAKSHVDFITTLLFTNAENKEVKFKVSGKLIYEDASAQSAILKFTLDKETDVNRDLERLERYNDIFHETNEIARVGGWEIDFIKGQLIWTKVTRDIHEVSADYVPQLDQGLQFYKEGWSRDKITTLFNAAVEKNLPFDEELKLVTAKGNEIWVRALGKPEFRDGKCVRVYGAFQDIDAQKKYEIELQTTKDRFKKIFTNSSIGILLVNTDNKLLMVNSASLKIFGFKERDRAKVLNLTFRDVIHPDDLQQAALYRQQLLAGEITSYKLESRFKKVTGEIIWCTVNTSIIYGHSQADDLIITQFEDITSRKELESKSLENSKKFMNAFEYSPNGMGVVTPDGKWLMVNQNLSKMIGYSKDELLELNFKDITHPEDLNNDIDFLKEIISKERESYSIEKRYIHKNGSIIHGFLTVSALADEHGRPTSLIGQVVDMTKSKKAQRALEHSLHDLQSLMNATTQVSIIETDLKGNVRKFNRGAENLLGYTAEEAIGSLHVSKLHDVTEVKTRSEELSLEYDKKVSGFDVFTSKAKKGNFESREWTFIRKDGSRFPVQLVVTSISNHKGKITGYLGVATDITQLKKMEASLVSAKLKAESASKSKSEFLANMSHEIRTPLNGVIGFTDLLMKTDLTPSQEKYMQTVNNSANTLLDLLNDILDFSKIEAGKLEINEEKIDLQDLCSQTIDIIRHQAHAKGLEVLLNIPVQNNRFIYADSVRLRQILTNLLGNAVKFTEKGEVELNIQTIACDIENAEMVYRFSIRDTGIGIAPHNLKKIFHAFDQEDGSTTRKYGGTGLGVTISNKLLELMGSKLEVESTMGEGSVFSFEVKFRSETPKSTASSIKKDIKNVLVVDANENNRIILQEMLAVDKIKSTLINNGIEALDVLGKDQEYDLAIIDYHMPYLNGIDLIKHMREKLNISSEDLPIILLHSSGDDEKVVQACKELDVHYNTVKPIQINKLYEMINNLESKDNTSENGIGVLPEVDLSALTYTILVAEDNPVNKFLTKTIINKILPLANIIDADDGSEAVEVYKSTPIDLILMDVQMPVLSGFEASQEIRAIEKKGDRIPIIALTARTLIGERERCMSYGMDDYITKPVVLETLQQVIIEHLVMNTQEKSALNS